MSWLQELFGRLSPGEAESREWMIRCPRCDAERSMWEAGGVRYKAAGRKRTLARCRACGRLVWAIIERKRAA